MASARIAVIGSAMVDLFAPRAGQRLSEIDSLAFTAGGSATIVAAAAAGLGAVVSLISAVGNDELGVEWRRRAEALGVDAAAVVTVPGQLTPLSVSTIDLAGEKTYGFYRFPGYCDPLALLEDSDLLRSICESVDVLVVTEAAVRARSSRSTVEKLLRHRNQTPDRLTVLSINYRPAGWASADEAAATLRSLAAATSVVCCNEEEYRLIDGDSLRDRIIYETAGANGVAVHAGADATTIPAPQLAGSIHLDTGAGDTFCGAIAVALAEAKSPAAAARFASVAAGLAIRREGTATAVPSRAEVEHALAAPSDTPAPTNSRGVHS